LFSAKQQIELKNYKKSIETIINYLMYSINDSRNEVESRD